MQLATGRVLALARISIGFIFLWAFLDKLIGLGFATCRDKATGEYLGLACEKSFIQGGKVTLGYLSNSVGPFATMFKAMAGNLFIEWVFMIGLLCIGVGLMLGAAMRLSTYSASLMLLLMWLAVLPKANNPFMDDHLVYILLLLVLNWQKSGLTCGIGNWWNSLPLIKKAKILQ
jgi:thiosulfate dehydrogenase (quinone) large subunit